MSISQQRFVDNGQTVTDSKTGLMWEKMRENGSADWREDLHSVSATCTWAEATGDWIDAVNKKRFAGFDDWRLPMVHELISIVDYEQRKPPAMNPVFGLVASLPHPSHSKRCVSASTDHADGGSP